MDRLPCVISEECDNRIKAFIRERLDIDMEHPLGKGVFNIARKYAIVVRYPLVDEEENDAFMLRDIPSFQGDQKFIFVNTSKTTEKQVFATAHELGHVLGIYNELGIKEYDEERIVNRFAADLLMPDKAFRSREKEEIAKRKRNEEISFMEFMNVVVEAMNYYCTTFDAVVIRFYELGILSEESAEYLVSEESKEVVSVILEQIINEKGYDNLLSVTKSKSIDGLDELLESIEEKGELPPKAVRLKEKYKVITNKDGLKTKKELIRLQEDFT